MNTVVYAHAVVPDGNLGYQVYVPTFNSAMSPPYKVAYFPKSQCKVLPREEDTRMIPVIYMHHPDWSDARECPGYEIDIMSHRGDRVFVYKPVRVAPPISQSRLPAFA